MQKRMLIYFCFMISYSGALLHSFIPHHHHVTVKEATNHHHHGHEKTHSHEDGKGKEDKHDSEPYFLTHAVNEDVLVNHPNSEKVVKVAKVIFAPSLSEIANSYYLFENVVFHPPQNDLLRSRLVHFPFSLRGPPFIA